MLGVAQKLIGKSEDALKTLNQALVLAPDDYDIMNNIGGVLYEQGAYEKAAEQFLKALALKGDGSVAVFMKSRCGTLKQPGERTN